MGVLQHLAAHYDMEPLVTGSPSSSPSPSVTDAGAPLIVRGHVVRCLLSQRAPVDARDDTGGTPLHVAAHHSNILAVRLLLQAGASATVCNLSNQPPTSPAPVIQVLLNLAAQKEQQGNVTPEQARRERLVTM
mgnify:FL=1